MSIVDALNRHTPTLSRVLRHLGRGRFEFVPPRFTYALGDLHGRIKNTFSSTPGIYFEAGANDGLTQSNTAYLEKYCGWRGVLVEPIPHRYIDCCLNRPNSITAHAALVPIGYDQPFVELCYSNLMTTSLIHGSYNPTEFCSRGQQHLGHEKQIFGQKFLAPAATVTDIWRQAGQPKIDFFSLDVEGNEIGALSGIDFSILRPRYFLIETEAPEAVQSLMRIQRYHLIDRWSHHDYFFGADPI